MNVLIASESRLLGEGMSMIIKSSFSEANIVLADCPSDLIKQLDIKTRNCWTIILIDRKLSEFISPRRIHKFSPRTKVCLFHSRNSKNTSQQQSEYLRQGFNGLLLPSSMSKHVERTINSLLLGNNVFPEEVDVHLNPPNHKNQEVSLNPILTFRQQEILSLMALGLSNKAIANHYNLTESTVKRHLSNIFKKLGANNRVDAARIGADSGLLLN